MRKENYLYIASHRAKCSLCASPNRASYEADLVAGGDVDRIRHAVNAEIKRKTGKRGTVSRRAILKHKELLPQLRPSGSWTEGALSAEEVLALPLSEVSERILRFAWAGCWYCMSELQRRLTDPSEEMSLSEVVESLRGLTDAYLVLRENPPLVAAAETTASRSSLIEIAAMIMDSEDKEAFIGMQRSMRGSIRQALRILEKYDVPGDARAGEDEPIHDDKAN